MLPYPPFSNTQYKEVLGLFDHTMTFNLFQVQIPMRLVSEDIR